MTDKFLSVPRPSRLIVFFVLILEFLAVAARADGTSNVYEAALVLPWKFVEQSINPSAATQSAQYDFVMNDLNFTAQDIPFVVPQAQLRASMHFKDVQSVGNVTNWESDRLSLQVNVGAFSLQKDIVQNINGIQVIVHLKADCAPFTLVQENAHTKMQWTWTVIDGQVSAILSAMDLDWPAGSWQVSGLQCSGPQGFADVVQNELQNQLADASALLPRIKATLQTSLNKKMTTWLTQWRKPQTLSQDKNIYLQLASSGVVSSKGLLFRMWLRFGDVSAEVDPTQAVPVNLSDDLLARVSDQPTLILSKTAVQQIARQRTLWPRVTTYLNSISGFHDLLNSRFLQFFIWIDLWNYSKKAPFYMITELNGDPSLSFGKGKQVWVQAPLGSWVISQRKGKSWYYIFLATQLKSWMTYGVRQGQFTLSAQNPSLNTKSYFGADYVNAFHPSTSIATSRLQSAVETAVNNQSERLNLPQIQVTDSLVLRASGLSQPDEDHFFMPWEKAPQ